MIVFYEVDLSTSQPFPVGDHLFFFSQTEIPKEVEDIVGPYRGINPLNNYIVHLAQTSEWAVAVPDDIEMAEMKIGGKPDVIHDNAK